LGVGMGGEKVFSCGHSVHFDYEYTEGFFLGTNHQGDVLAQLQCYWGNSGAGVFNAAGELVGLKKAMGVFSNSGTAIFDFSHSYLVPDAIIADFVSQI